MRKINAVLPICVSICILLLALNTYFCWESAEERLAPYHGKTVRATGYVDYASLVKNDGRSSFVLQVVELKGADGAIDYHQKLRVTIEGVLPEASVITLEGTLKELNAFVNPGCFAAKTNYWVQELGGQLARPQLLAYGGELSISQRLALFNLQLRQELEEKTASLNLDPQKASLLAGMILGGSSQLEEESRNLFIKNGLAHLLSVSGAHLLLLCSAAASLLAAFSRFCPGCKRLIKPFLAALMLFYALLCGLRPPIVRAVIMSLLVLLLDRKRQSAKPFNSLYLLLLTALILLCYKPLWLLDLGFQLSFGCTLGIIYLAPLITAKLRSLEWLEDNLQEMLGVTLAAQLAVLPLEIAYFHQLSLIGIISNLLLVPVLELCIVLTIVGMLLHELFLLPAVFLLEQVLLQAELLSRLPFSTVVIGYLPPWCAILYYALLLLLLDVPISYTLGPREKWGAVLALTLILGCTYWYEHLRLRPLQAYFLCVGQGDATLIRTPHGRLVLIDTGGLRHYATGSRIIAPVLKYLDRSRLDLLILTHWDYDHVGGTVSLAQQLPISRLVYPDQLLTQGKEDEEGEQLRKAILGLTNIEVKEKALAGSVYSCDGVDFKIIYTGEGVRRGNSASTVISVADRILLMGDLPLQQEEQLELGPHQLLKLGHHGSHTSTGEALLEKVRPAVAVASCGRHNIYGHPHPKVLKRLQQHQIALHRTDIEGCIIYEVGE